MRFLATVAKGLEPVVAEELRSLGLDVLEQSPGIVAFKGRRQDAWRANLHLRAARRVLQPLRSFEAPSAEALYEGAASIPWGDFLTPQHTFAVEASVKDSAFSHSGFVALKVKDAVADVLRQRAGARPDVDRRDPDVGIVVHVERGQCMLSLDTSGGPLHKRGYRVQSVRAPLNETLAAGILLLAGYDGETAFADPFCGSGTFLIEAALIATRTPPGLIRNKPFGFQRWPGFEPQDWKAMLEEARSGTRKAVHPILGSDRDARAVAAALANAKAAGMDGHVEARRADLRTFQPPSLRGLMAANPPYGDHAGGEEDLTSLYRELGDVLKRRCAGWTACVLTGDPALAKFIGLRPRRKVPLYNGPTECRLLMFELYEGTMKGKSRGAGEEKAHVSS